jgi:hypothetical protein
MLSRQLRRYRTLIALSGRGRASCRIRAPRYHKLTTAATGVLSQWSTRDTTQQAIGRQQDLERNLQEGARDETLTPTRKEH